MCAMNGPGNRLLPNRPGVKSAFNRSEFSGHTKGNETIYFPFDCEFHSHKNMDGFRIGIVHYEENQMPMEFTYSITLAWR